MLKRLHTAFEEDPASEETSEAGAEETPPKRRQKTRKKENKTPKILGQEQKKMLKKCWKGLCQFEEEPGKLAN